MAQILSAATAATPHWLVRQRTKKRWPLLLALLTGLLLSLSWYPPFTFLSFVALLPLLELEQHYYTNSRKWNWLKLFGLTWLAFSIWNIGVYWWLWEASGWMTLAAWFANALLQSLPIVVFHLVKKLSWDKFSYLAFASAWLSFELLHLHWDFSWVWLNLGNVFANTPSWVQWYELTGSMGGSLWILLANIAIYVLLSRGEIRTKSWVVAVVVLVPLAASLIRYFSYTPAGEAAEVVVVQPNFHCYTEKFHYNAKTGEVNQPTHVPYPQQVSRMLELTKNTVTPATKIVAWPETALHQNIRLDQPFADQQLARVQQALIGYDSLTLITGADVYQVYGKQPQSVTSRFHESLGYYDKYNSAIQLDQSGDTAFYQKSKLVIGAETVPLRSLLKGIMLNLGGTSGGLGSQPERETFYGPDSLAIAPVICYESVYGEFVTEYVKAGAQALVVITNDGWWGNTPGHVQHMNYARLRAIETRKDVARSANTGVSCFIDQKGNLTASLPYRETGALAGQMLFNDVETFYVRMGDYLGRVSSFLLGLMLLASLVKSRLLRDPVNKAEALLSQGAKAPGSVSRDVKKRPARPART